MHRQYQSVYLTYKNRHQYYQEFDGLLIADISEKTPAKYRIIKCNEYMVNESDFMICYVRCSWGGAAKTLDYARGKIILKL